MYIAISLLRPGRLDVCRVIAVSEGHATAVLLPVPEDTVYSPPAERVGAENRTVLNPYAATREASSPPSAYFTATVSLPLPLRLHAIKLWPLSPLKFLIVPEVPTASTLPPFTSSFALASMGSA